ncbi:MAG: hypothetical protein ACON4J_07285 [Parvibaculales bacterium]
MSESWSKGETTGQCSCTGLSRRHFILAGLSTALMASQVLADGHGDKARLIAGSAKADGKRVSGEAILAEKPFKLVTGKDAAIAAIGSNVFLLSPGTEIDFEIDGENRFSGFKIALGAVHSVFTPKAGNRRVETPHATIGIRGTGHYVEVQPDLKRTYSCCCYGGIELKNTTSGVSVAQETAYHEARIITADGAIGPAPYDVPLNHYDDSLVHLESLVGRSPHWTLPGGELIFLSPTPIPQ